MEFNYRIQINKFLKSIANLQHVIQCITPKVFAMFEFSGILNRVTLYNSHKESQYCKNIGFTRNVYANNSARTFNQNDEKDIC